MARPRRSRAWWQQTVTEFLASGQSRAAFAARRQIHAETLRHWQGVLARKAPASPRGDGLVLLEVGEAAPAPGPAVLEATVGPAELRFLAGTDARYIGAVVAAIAQAVGRC